MHNHHLLFFDLLSIFALTYLIRIALFTVYCIIMVFHRSLSDSMSPQVSWTLLSILVDLYTAVVWMVCTCSLISKFSSPFNNPLGIVPSAPTTIGITVPFLFAIFFSSRARFRYLFLFSPSFNFILWSTRIEKSTVRQILFFSFFFPRFIFFVNSHLVWSSGRNQTTHLYFKISETFEHLILKDGFWVVHIPLARMTKY